MFDVGKTLRRRSALWLIFPVALPLITLIISRSADSHVSPLPSPARETRSAIATRTEPDLTADLDHDGLPDITELRSFNDRENFRRWFTWLAEMQFYKFSDEWNPEQRDCAGLVRFAWREALRTHDRSWFQRMGEDYKSVAPDVSVKLGSEPLGEKLFRTAPGNYRTSDLAAGKFSEFADAQTLKLFNATFVSRNRAEAKPGDLLFFYQPYVQKFPYHVMIFLGDAWLANEGENDWVVYHTGAAPENGGAVKKVRLAVLDHHPNARWRPTVGNSNFLGFYRLKVFDQGLKLLDQQVSWEE
jgi:uncharacterized protein YfaT (DUF1175 family)